MPVLGQNEETVLVRIEGKPGQKLFLRLKEQIVHLGEADKGQYTSQVRIPSTGTHQLELLQDGLAIASLGKITSQKHSRIFLASGETVTRQGPNPVYDRLTPLYNGQQVAIDGSRGAWHRCRESGTWIDGRKTKNGPRSGVFMGPLVPNRLNRVRVTEDHSGDAILILEMNRPAELQVEERLAEKSLVVTIYDTYQTTFDVRRPSHVAQFLGPIVLRPSTNPRAVKLRLSADEFSGYQIESDPNSNNLRLRIRKPMAKTLTGLKITVDAGHGGEKDFGAVGVGGLKEKTLNLRVAKVLAQKLRQLGAQVSMTRTVDGDVATKQNGDGSELQARIDYSIAQGDQLFLSLHHNARASIKESRVFHGTDVYWYQPQSQALAKALANPIANAVGEKLRSYRWRSFYVIRQTHSPAVLIEFQYISNPTLESQVLSDPSYPEKAADGVVQGLLKYVSRPR